jgi:hypothetical protein
MRQALCPSQGACCRTWNSRNTAGNREIPSPLLSRSGRLHAPQVAAQRRFSPHVLAVPSDSGLFWSSSVAMTCLINLFVNGVIARSGAAVEKRLERISGLFEHFIGFVGERRTRHHGLTRDLGSG